MSDEVNPEVPVNTEPAKAESVEYAVALTYLLRQMHRAITPPHHPLVLLTVDPVGGSMQVIVPQEIGKLLLHGDFRKEIVKVLESELESIAVRSTLELP